jgi:hypothetical protein
MDQDVRGEPAELDAVWMTEALEGAGVARGSKVTDVVVDGLIGTGQTGRNARFTLTWDDPTDRPATLVGKFPSADPSAKMAAFGNGTYRTEWAFYTQLAQTVGIRSPVCHVARYDQDAAAFVLLMEDLAGSVQGDQFEGLTADRAALAVEQAVGLHAPRWGDATLVDFVPERAKGDDSAMMLGMAFQMMVDPFLERLGSRLDPEIVALTRRLAPKAGQWAMGTDTPRTVAHLDFRPDNFMFGTTPDAPPLVVVDWQTVANGFAMWDLAYMIGGSFEPEVRASIERDLLTDYLARMAAAGVQYDFDTCWRDYRNGALWGLVMSVLATILAAETQRGNEMFILMATRAGRHALDLDSMGLLN